MSNDVHRLHRLLIDAIERGHGDLEQPVTVSQIYQELVPYRAARSSAGFEMNADYEHAVLRLLAGEDDLVRLEPPEVRTLLQRELDTPNPNVSLFRAYANCDVYVSSSGEWASSQREEPEVEIEFEEEPIAPHTQETAEPAQFRAPEHQERSQQSESTTSTRQCSFCEGALPGTRLLNFCPHCGNDLTRQPCSKCGEVLEPNWRFCVSCGAPAASYGSDAN